MLLSSLRSRRISAGDLFPDGSGQRVELARSAGPPLEPSASCAAPQVTASGLPPQPRSPNPEEHPDAAPRDHAPPSCWGPQGQSDSSPRAGMVPECHTGL